MFKIEVLLLLIVMALLRITTKREANVNGVHIEKGMSVEVLSPTVAPFSNMKAKEEIAKAFMTKYGVDLKKANALANASLFVVEKLN